VIDGVDFCKVPLETFKGLLTMTGFLMSFRFG